MSKVKYMLLTAVLVLTMVAPAFAWTTNSYRSESSYSRTYQTAPADWDTQRYYSDRIYDRDFDRPYYREYRDYDYSPYYVPYYRPGFRLDVPFFHFGFGY